MRFVSDQIEEVSPIMIPIIMGSSLLAFAPLCYLLVKMYDPNFDWADSSSDYKILCFTTLFVGILMGGLIWMFYNMKIDIKADEKKISARIFPFMRSFRISDLSDVYNLEIGKIGGFMKYGGIGLKNNLGGLTSYTLTGSGHVLKIKLKNKKALHVQISKIEEWKRYIAEFEKQRT